jgi:hypothetical protein
MSSVRAAPRVQSARSRSRIKSGSRSPSRPPLVGFARGATPETAAPEVGAGWATRHPPAAFTTDVYSLGATAHWLLAGQPPVNLSGIKGIAARMAAAAAQTTPRLREVAPHVPASVASVIERAMAVNPADRYQTVAEFSAALGSRSTKPRRWRRTNEHAGHLGCWRGERPRKSTYILCLEQGATAKQCTVTTRHSTGAKCRRVSALRQCVTQRRPCAQRSTNFRDCGPSRRTRGWNEGNSASCGLHNVGKSREFHHVSGHFDVRVMKFDARGSTAESKNPSLCWGSRSGASRTRTGDLLGAIRATKSLE